MDWDAITPLIYLINGLLIKVLYDLWRDVYIEKKRQRKESLKKHFDELLKGAIKPLYTSSASIYITSNGSIFTSEPESLKYLDAEQLECFKVHYKLLGEKWHKLRTGWREHNKKVEAFEQKVKTVIEMKCLEKNIYLPLKRWNREELINDRLPSLLCVTIYSKGQGKGTDCDFKEAKIEPANDFYVLELQGEKWARAKSRDIVEKCKLVFTLVQNSSELLKQVSPIIKDAQQIKSEFEQLETKLGKLLSHGFIIKDPNYRFQAIKTCHICKELFY